MSFPANKNTLTTTLDIHTQLLPYPPTLISSDSSPRPSCGCIGELETEIWVDATQIANIDNQITYLDRQLYELRSSWEGHHNQPTHNNCCELCAAIRRAARIAVEAKIAARRFRQWLRRRLRFNEVFGSLLCEIRLYVLRFTQINDLGNVAASGMAAGEVYALHKWALLRGIEDEQYPYLKWLFGNSKSRSRTQKQALEDYVTTFVLPMDQHWGRRLLIMMEHNLVDVDLIVELQRIDNNIAYMERAFNVTLRAALCLIMLRTKRMTLYNANSGTLSHSRMGLRRPEVQLWWTTKLAPLRERLPYFYNQSAEIKADIRRCLEDRVLALIEYYKKRSRPDTTHYNMSLEQQSQDWLVEYDIVKDEPKMDGSLRVSWIANLLVGFVLEVLMDLTYWTKDFGDDVIKQIHEMEIIFDDALDMEFDNFGSTDKLWSYGRNLAKHIGFDYNVILKNTTVGYWNPQQPSQ